MDLEKNRKRWKKLLADHQDSGLTIKQFCWEHDVKVHEFQYYKKRFKQETVQNETETSSFVEVVQPKLIMDDKITMNLNGLDIKMDYPNLVKLLKTVKQLD
jgi:hypothetical protein